MNKSGYLFILVIYLLFNTCNSSPEYNLNIPPPSDTSWPEDIYPAEIDGLKPDISTKDYGGTLASYGKNKSIYVARMANHEEAVQFFKKYILTEFNDLSSPKNGTVDGYFYSKAKKGNKTCFGWVNKRYIFVLKADTKEDFNQLVDNFAYISRK